MKPADVTGVILLVKWIKEIVDLVLKEGKADTDASKGDKKKDIGKLFTMTTDGNRADNVTA